MSKRSAQRKRKKEMMFERFVAGGNGLVDVLAGAE